MSKNGSAAVRRKKNVQRSCANLTISYNLQLNTYFTPKFTQDDPL